MAGLIYRNYFCQTVKTLIRVCSVCKGHIDQGFFPEWREHTCLIAQLSQVLGVLFSAFWCSFSLHFSFYSRPRYLPSCNPVCSRRLFSLYTCSALLIYIFSFFTFFVEKFIYCLYGSVDTSMHLNTFEPQITKKITI